jgi:hypothetical protein
MAKSDKKSPSHESRSTMMDGLPVMTGSGEVHYI